MLEHYGTPGVHAQTQGAEKRMTGMTAIRLPEITLLMISMNPYCEAEMMQNRERIENRENRTGLCTDFYLQLVRLG